MATRTLSPLDFSCAGDPAAQMRMSEHAATTVKTLVAYLSVIEIPLFREGNVNQELETA
jgi:hypothetical protein